MRSYTRRIFKYPIKIESRQMIQMPKGARILDVGRQGPLPYLWASVDPDAPVEPRIIRLVTTGEVYNEERLDYIGHLQLGGEGPLQGWFEAWLFEVETALPQLSPDPISDRFKDDLDEVRRESTEAVAA